MRMLGEVQDYLLSNAGILISAVSGVFALFHDKWRGRLWKSLPFIGVIGGVLWALAGAQHDAKQHRDDMEAVITRVNAWITQQSQAIQGDIDLLRKQIVDQGTLTSVAQAATPDQVGEIVKANRDAGILVSAQTQQARQALTIRVFNHFTKDVNFDLVKPRLEQLGATVKVLPPKVNAPTNSVWWGPGSNLDEAKAAALIAASAGVQIRQICHSVKPHPDVSNLIQIGGSVQVEREKKMTVMSAEEIQNLSAPRCLPGSEAEQ